jgi:ATP synthase protein I
MFVFDFKKNQALTGNVQIVMRIGLTMAGCIMLCLFTGLKIDEWLGTKGVFLTIFTLLGIVGGGIVVYSIIMEVMEPEKEEINNSENGVN